MRRRFRNHLHREGLSAATCNTVVKGILNGPFQLAYKLGYIAANPVSAVEPLRKRDEDRAEREPFTRLKFRCSWKMRKATGMALSCSARRRD